jgi:hypothetical protein
LGVVRVKGAGGSRNSESQPRTRRNSSISLNARNIKTGGFVGAVGPCKTESSQKPLPVHRFFSETLASVAGSVRNFGL